MPEVEYFIIQHEGKKFFIISKMFKSLEDARNGYDYVLNNINPEAALSICKTVYGE